MIDKETLKRLEFDRILETVAALAHCEASRTLALAIAPLGGRCDMELRFGLVEELRKLSRLGISLKLSGFEDITRQIRGVRPAGAVLVKLDPAPLTEPTVQNIVRIDASKGRIRVRLFYSRRLVLVFATTYGLPAMGQVAAPKNGQSQ